MADRPHLQPAPDAPRHGAALCERGRDGIRRQRDRRPGRRRADRAVDHGRAGGLGARPRAGGRSGRDDRRPIGVGWRGQRLSHAPHRRGLRTVLRIADGGQSQGCATLCERRGGQDAGIGCERVGRRAGQGDRHGGQEEGRGGLRLGSESAAIAGLSDDAAEAAGGAAGRDAALNGEAVVSAPREWSAVAARIPPGGSEKFPVAWRGRRLEGFVVNFEGRFHAYVNLCIHAGTPLDWWPNEFFTEDGRLLICATHGALFTPDTGHCAGGPCGGGSLYPLPVRLDGDRVVVTTDDDDPPDHDRA
ncbi:MAG: hypothetical protein DMD79_14880 [Candidatus Rokuibacteriota bacterium]|nr:MAG: hypothetical protein DMD79_14880 [Candidatus Rokubacteria bacterium]